MQWLINNYIQVLGVIFGLIYLYLEIKQNIWLWPFGLLTSVFFVYVFYVSKFYADMGLQVYYVLISIYGWWKWFRGVKPDVADDLPVTRITLRQLFALVPISIALFAIIAYVLINFTDSPVPYGDAFTTALSIVATWMLTHKILEQWWLWVVVNLVSLVLYVYKGLYPTSVLFIFYFSMSVVGYFEWKRTMKQQAVEGINGK